MMKVMKVKIFLSLIFLVLVDKSFSSYPFSSVWLTSGIGLTNEAFKKNSGNDGRGIYTFISIAASIYSKYSLKLNFSKAKEFQAPMYDVYNPIEYVRLTSVMVGRYFVVKNICIFPAVGISAIKGVNRGKWIGDPGVESYECETLPYNGIGIPFVLQINTNSSGLVGIGFQLFSNFYSNKNFWGISLLIKAGKQK